MTARSLATSTAASIRHSRTWTRAADWAARRHPLAARQPAVHATDDLAIAYRLLLGREPDPSGAAFFGSRLAAGTLTTDQLVAELLRSGEFSRLHPDLVGPYRSSVEDVDVDDFVITVESGDWAVGGAIATNRRYEPEVTATVRSLLSPGGTFVDVGANIGWFSLLAASIVGPRGSVLAVEPNLRNCELLTTSRERNGFTHIDIVAGAVSDEEAWLALETDASNGRVIPLGPMTPETTPIRCSYAVPAFTLDRLLVDRGLITRVDAMKVDVEGVETRVFAGAARLLGEVHPAVVFEWYPEALRSTGQVDPVEPLHVLRRHGYAISVVGHPSAAGAGADLSDREIDAVRVEQGRDLLDLLARHLSQAPG